MVPTTKDLIGLARAYLNIAGNEAGGTCHIVLDDHNVGDDDIVYCMKLAKKEGDAAGVLLMALMFTMTRTQRLKIARSAWTLV